MSTEPGLQTDGKQPSVADLADRFAAQATKTVLKPDNGLEVFEALAKGLLTATAPLPKR